MDTTPPTRASTPEAMQNTTDTDKYEGTQTTSHCEESTEWNEERKWTWDNERNGWISPDGEFREHENNRKEEQVEEKREGAPEQQETGLMTLMARWGEGEGYCPVLPDIDWPRVLPKFPPINKEFYMEHPAVSSRSELEVDVFRKTNKIQVVSGENIAKPVTTFDEASFPSYLTRKLHGSYPNGHPTPIQAQVWPLALQGRDIVAIAETGSGKTLAYLLPAIVHLNNQAPVVIPGEPIVLVLAPTRELASQIAEEALYFGAAVRDDGAEALRVTYLFGGVKKREQLEQMNRDVPDMIVATPGRLLDMMSDGSVCLRRVTFFVVDEADRMILLGFWKQVKMISGQIRPDRQCIMLSATWPKEVRDISLRLCRENPVHINVGEVSDNINDADHFNREKQRTARSVKQEIICLPRGDKYYHLLNELLPKCFEEHDNKKRDTKVLIFTSGKKSVDSLVDCLRRIGWPAVGIHSGKEQAEREWIFDQFKGRLNTEDHVRAKRSEAVILVATDIMARGMDFVSVIEEGGGGEVRYVINFDFPESCEDYIHRIGRTGRAGHEGNAYSYFTEKDFWVAKEMVPLLRESNVEIPPMMEKVALDPSYWPRHVGRGGYGGGNGYSVVGEGWKNEDNSRGGYGDDRYKKEDWRDNNRSGGDGGRNWSNDNSNRWDNNRNRGGGGWNNRDNENSSRGGDWGSSGRRW
ncbi:hypothetical protein FOL47_011285 [Perkinsus chesapeaki]|uniref:RNA helicase n=1 Tax=Perkinsus chesapeaki TaxID=330153 RepID=A0A7J6MMU0_PERCH|nr:hypothetical protein FOL47_011285 [Perkinsus chesapeaki]